MKNFAIKFISFFVIGLVLEIIISTTIPLQAKHLTYILGGTAYLFMGMLSQKYRLSSFQKLLLLSPLTIIKVFAVIVNKWNLPFVFPFTFFISLIGFFVGYYLIQKKNRPLIHLFFVLYASLIYIIGFIVSPQIIYSRSIRDPNIYPKARINSWDLLDLKGNSYSFENVRGKVVLLNFTWKGCGQCIQKQPFTNILKQKYKSNNRLIILEVDLGKFDTMEDAITFSKKGNKNLLWVYDPQNKLAERLLFEGAPHEVLIDSKGHIDFISAGFNKDISLIYLQEISQKIDKALLEIRNN